MVVHRGSCAIPFGFFRSLIGHDAPLPGALWQVPARRSCGGPGRRLVESRDDGNCRSGKFTVRLPRPATPVAAPASLHTITAGAMIARVIDSAAPVTIS